MRRTSVESVWKTSLIPTHIVGGGREQSPAVPMSKEEKAELFVYLWLLGNDLGDSGFQNPVIDHLQGVQFMPKEKLRTDVILHIFQETRSQSGLRLWVMDHIVGIRPATLQRLTEHLTKTTICELLLQSNGLWIRNMEALQDTKDNMAIDKCKYHEHAEDEQRCDGISVQGDESSQTTKG